MRQNNRRFFTSFQGFPYGYGGYGYGNTVYQNPDEADWAEQWQSLYEDNHGAYAKSTLENPQGACANVDISARAGGRDRDRTNISRMRCFRGSLRPQSQSIFFPASNGGRGVNPTLRHNDFLFHVNSRHFQFSDLH